MRYPIEDMLSVAKFKKKLQKALNANPIQELANELYFQHNLREVHLKDYFEQCNCFDDAIRISLLNHIREIGVENE